MSPPRSKENGARTVARKLVLQALYRWQLNDCPWQDLVSEFADAEDAPRADMDYLRELLEAICTTHEALDSAAQQWLDRKPSELDPVEHAALLIGIHELGARPEVPFRVAISEAVNLSRKFGATDGHKFVNAVLDRAARVLRPGEH
ncbi:MAG: transcription antitermination factor NusB [Steroidobacteraceae bacterium]